MIQAEPRIKIETDALADLYLEIWMAFIHPTKTYNFAAKAKSRDPYGEDAFHDLHIDGQQGERWLKSRKRASKSRSL